MTGAAGFAGSHLLDLLGGTGAELHAWHRPGGRPPVTGAAPSRTRICWRGVDVLDRAEVGRAVAQTRPDIVYHCAGAAHVGQAWHATDATLRVNVMGTVGLLEALELAGCPARVVITGSALVYRVTEETLTEDSTIAPTSPYGLSKLAQEEVALDIGRGSHVAVMVARAFNHLGPRQDPGFVGSAFARQIAEIECGRRAPIMEVGNLEARRDLTDVRDTVRAYRDIGERGQPGRVYNVCSGRAWAIRALLDGLVALARVPVSVQIDQRLYRPNDAPLVVGSHQRLRDELGWTPAIPVETTLRDLLDYWRQRVAHATPIGS